MTPRVVGLDLSLTSTGIALPFQADDGTWTVDAHRVRSKGKKDDTLYQRHTRLVGIASGIQKQIPTDAVLAVIEQPAYSRTTGHMHDRSGLWWLVVDMIRSWGLPLAEVSPSSRVKYALGKGGGKDTGKDNVLAAAINRYPGMAITGNDVADAVLLAAMGLDHLGHPPAEVPKLHRAALDAVTWPEVAL